MKITTLITSVRAKLEFLKYKILWIILTKKAARIERNIREQNEYMRFLKNGAGLPSYFLRMDHKERRDWLVKMNSYREIKLLGPLYLWRNRIRKQIKDYFRGNVNL